MSRIRLVVTCREAKGERGSTPRGADLGREMWERIALYLRIIFRASREDIGPLADRPRPSGANPVHVGEIPSATRSKRYKKSPFKRFHSAKIPVYDRRINPTLRSVLP